MRGAAAFALAISASLLVLGPASAQRSTTGTAPPLVAPAPALAPALRQQPRRSHRAGPARLGGGPPPAPRSPRRKCDNPNALGVSRTVEIDTTGGPGFGFEHFKQLDFLRDHEVVLTFDDGPWPTTPAVLKALAAECVKAIFFPIGKHATYYPEILRQVAAAGHTIGSHTWSHVDLSRSKTPEEAKAEIEKAISAVKWALEDQGQDGAVLPLPGAAASARDGHLSRHAQHRDLLDRHGLVRLQDAQARTGREVGHGQAAEARQRHRADARLPEGDFGSGAAAARRAQGRRLQDRAHEAARTP